MTKLKIKAGGYEFTGTLLEEEAPETCKVFKGMLT